MATTDYQWPSWTPNLPTTGGSTSTQASSTSGGFSASGLASSAAPLLLSLFGPSNKGNAQATDTLNTIKTQGLDQLATGKATAAKGTDALAPVLQYLQSLVGGNPADLLFATQGQRARVLDQYDTARKGLQFTPRSGGQASATLGLEAEKAKQITDQTAEAKSNAVGQLGSLGSGLLSAGNQQQSAGMAALDQAFAGYSQQGQQEAQQQASLGAQIGKLAATVLPFFF